MPQNNTFPNLSDLPEPLQPYLKGSKLSDSSSHSGATVLYSDRGYYLKIDQATKLQEENLLARYFYELNLGVQVLEYLTYDDMDYLLTKEANGYSALSFLENPQEVCFTLANALKKLHSLTPKDFPIQDRLENYRKIAQENYQKGLFYEKALLPQFGITTKEEAYKLIQEKGHLLTNNALIHGDACLPNIILKDAHTFSSFIDLGLAGISDLHIDLYWVIWSLNYNLGTPIYGDLFLDYYGREQINMEHLSIVAAFEAFG